MKVMGYGNKDSAITIVGEAPGEQEVAKGRPFVGRAGQHLAMLCNKAGVNFTDLYLTNVVKERPPNNDISHFINLEKEPRPTQAYIQYEAELLEELRQTTSNVIVACGAVPLWALCRQKGITKWRGSILESVTLPGRKVIPIIHPAAALRQYIYNHLIVHDLRRVKEESVFPDIQLPEYDVHMRKSADEVLAYIHSIKGGRIGFDIEVVKEQVDCLSIAKSKKEAMCIAFQEKSRDVYSIEDETDIWRAIALLLQNPDVEKVMQNAVFDCSFLFTRYGIRTVNVHDTMIAQGLLTPGFPKDLGFISSIHTRHPYYKDDAKMYKSVDMPVETWWLYNARDALVLLDILPSQLDDLKRLNLMETYNSHRALIPILTHMQYHGIKMDLNGMKIAADNATIKIAQLQQKLNHIAGCELNPNSPKQLKSYFYITKNIRPYTKDGSPTVDETAMTRLAAQGHEEALIILEMRRLVKMRGTYFGSTLDPDNRLRCSFNPIGTVTGRLSSSKTIFGTGMNMQNQPREMKKYMLVDDGYVAYSMDLANAENRIVANMGPVPAMKEAFDKGIDVHALTASMLFDIPIDQVSDEPGSAPNIGSGLHSQRYWGKKINHSSNFGIGPIKLGLSLGIPTSQARYLLEKYHERYPEVRFGYQAQIKSQYQRFRRVFNCFGRSRNFLDRFDEEQAYAFPPQSTVADIINRRGLIFIWQRVGLFEELIILNQVHDSIIVEIPLSIGFKRHSEMLTAIKTNIEQPLRWKASEWVIPLEISMCYPTLHDQEDLTSLDPESLSKAYEKLTSL